MMWYVAKKPYCRNDGNEAVGKDSTRVAPFSAC